MDLSPIDASSGLADEQIEAELLNTLIGLVVERAVNDPTVFGEARERLAQEAATLAAERLAPRIEALVAALTGFTLPESILRERPCGAREVAAAVDRLNRSLTDRTAAPARQGGCRFQPRPAFAPRELCLMAGLILAVGILAGILIGQRWSAKVRPVPVLAPQAAAHPAPSTDNKEGR